MTSKGAVDDVFINCPFDTEYSPIFRGLVFTIYACAFRPRSARETDDGGEARIEKLFRLIDQCRYGIHDISRTQLDVSKLPRFNMPFELGLFLGAKRYGRGLHAEKKLLIFDKEQYRYQKFLSDLAGMDIHEHRNDVRRAIVETRNWLTTVSRRTLPSGQKLYNLYQKFIKQFPSYARSADLDPDDVAYADFERLVAGWLTQ